MPDITSLQFPPQRCPDADSTTLCSQEALCGQNTFYAYECPHQMNQPPWRGDPAVPEAGQFADTKVGEGTESNPKAKLKRSFAS